MYLSKMSGWVWEQAASDNTKTAGELQVKAVDQAKITTKITVAVREVADSLSTRINDLSDQLKLFMEKVELQYRWLCTYDYRTDMQTESKPQSTINSIEQPMITHITSTPATGLGKNTAFNQEALDKVDVNKPYMDSM